MCETFECVREYMAGVRDSDSLDRYPNPVYGELKCGLLNNKKTSYYTATSRPSPNLAKIPHLLEGIDMTTRDNCCMCFAFSLYYKKPFDYHLYSYLATISRSVGNIKRFLPNWIARIYIDPTVFKALTAVADEEPSTLETQPRPRGWQKRNTDLTADQLNTLRVSALSLLEALYKADNVELYTFFCDPSETIAYRRTYRFLPMIDPTVAAYAIREADGIVSATDCNNLDCMVINNYPIYIVPMRRTIPCFTKGYSKWLQIYQEIDPFFSNQGAIFDMLAGLFSGTIKVIPEYYYLCMRDAVSFVEDKDAYASKTDIDLSFALDEVFLLRLYRNIVSIEKRDIFLMVADAQERLKLLLGACISNYLEFTYDYIKRRSLKFDVSSIWKRSKKTYTDEKYDFFPDPSLLMCSHQQIIELLLWFKESEILKRDNTIGMIMLNQMLERVVSPSAMYTNVIVTKGDHSITSTAVANSTHLGEFSILDKVTSIMQKIRMQTKRLVGRTPDVIRDLKFNVSLSKMNFDGFDKSQYINMTLRTNNRELYQTLFDQPAKILAAAVIQESWVPDINSPEDLRILETIQANNYVSTQKSTLSSIGRYLWKVMCRYNDISRLRNLIENVDVNSLFHAYQSPEVMDYLVHHPSHDWQRSYPLMYSYIKTYKNCGLLAEYSKHVSVAPDAIIELKCRELYPTLKDVNLDTIIRLGDVELLTEFAPYITNDMISEYILIAFDKAVGSANKQKIHSIFQTIIEVLDKFPNFREHIRGIGFGHIDDSEVSMRLVQVLLERNIIYKKNIIQLLEHAFVSANVPLIRVMAAAANEKLRKQLLDFIDMKLTVFGHARNIISGNEPPQ